MSRTGSEYTEEQIRKALLHLRLRDGNYKRTAEETGIAESNLRRWAQRYSHWMEELQWHIDVGVLDQLDQIIQKAAERIIEKLDIDKIPANILPTVLGVAIDKHEKISKALQAQLEPSNQKSLQFDQDTDEAGAPQVIPVHPGQITVPEAES